MRLIITEKNNSAKKIADILSSGSAKDDATYRVPFYTWSDSEGDHRTVGLKGHVMGVAFPDDYSNWQKTDLHDLIDAQLIPEPTDKNVVKAVRKLAKEADSVVIATDFDREGELIGHEALQQAMESNPEIVAGLIEERPPVKRARYSALTKDEIERAFSELDDLSYELAYAGAARQDIDLIWGATLTRAVSLATRRFGSNFLSVGRVQSPSLGLVVERELERRAHVPKPFWEVFAKFEHPDGSFEAHHATDKFWDEAEANAALAGTKSPGVVKDVTARKNSRKPPTPLNTTAFTTDASSRLGITPASAMRIAEDLYMDGFISYPRTDNTVYPKSLNTRELVQQMVRIPEFEAGAFVLDGPMEATRGKKETTDHPPIYPTQAVYPGALDEGPKRRVYELVVRRFIATFAPPMITESTRADIEAGSEEYFVRGSVVVDAGFAKIYTYARSSDDEIPALEAGQELALDGEPWSVGKETQPPSRISQGKLIELMEERGLGTKATRADIIQKLYDRGYVYSNPPIPSETGIAMYKAFKQYVPRMATPEMTAELERDMDLIAAGEMTKDARPGREPRDAPRDDEGDAGPIRGPGQGGLGGDGRGQVPRPLRGLRGARPHRPRGRRAEPPARYRPQGRQALLGLRGLQPRRSRARRLVPELGPAARPRLRAVAPRGELLGLRDAPAPDRQGLPRAPMEALPERRLPDDGRDAREARRAPGRQGSARGREGRGYRERRRSHGVRGRREGSGREATRGRPAPQAPFARHRPDEEGRHPPEVLSHERPTLSPMRGESGRFDRLARLSWAVVLQCGPL